MWVREGGGRPEWERSVEEVSEEDGVEEWGKAGCWSGGWIVSSDVRLDVGRHWRNFLAAECRSQAAVSGSKIRETRLERSLLTSGCT